MNTASVPKHEFLNSPEYLAIKELVASPLDTAGLHEEFKALASRVLSFCDRSMVVGFLDMQLECLTRDSMHQTPPVMANGPAGALIVWVAQPKPVDQWRLRYLEGLSSASLLDMSVSHRAYRWICGDRPQFRMLTPDRAIEIDRFDPDVTLVERERCLMGENALLHAAAGSVIQVEAAASAVLCEFISPPVLSYKWSFDRDTLCASRISFASLRLGRLQFLISAAKHVLPAAVLPQIEVLLQHPDPWIRSCAQEQLRALERTTA